MPERGGQIEGSEHGRSGLSDVPDALIDHFHVVLVNVQGPGSLAQFHVLDLVFSGPKRWVSCRWSWNVALLPILTTQPWWLG